MPLSSVGTARRYRGRSGLDEKRRGFAVGSDKARHKHRDARRGPDPTVVLAETDVVGSQPPRSSLRPGRRGAVEIVHWAALIGVR